LAIVAVCIFVNLGRPILFTQDRPGKNGAIFTLYKFRTMRDEYGKNGESLPDEKRLTTFGKILRHTSLDELPELWNIVRGDMSFVGPRPLLVEYLAHYSKTEKQRHTVRPGLTGLAQVSGRNALTWEKKFAYDVLYTKHISALGDLLIIGRTVCMVVKRQGITAQGSASVEKFRGHHYESR
jgi:lipopolysaccharide/colanic/teichoic acid biosynthesis glycosyltransferase